MTEPARPEWWRKQPLTERVLRVGPVNNRAARYELLKKRRHQYGPGWRVRAQMLGDGRRPPKHRRWFKPAEVTVQAPKRGAFRALAATLSALVGIRSKGQR